LKKLFKLLLLFIVLFILFSCDEDEPHFTVTFDSRGGTVVEEIVVNAGELIQLQVPGKEGYTFVGWFTGDGPNDVQFSSILPVLANMTLYATWSINKYTFTFDSNGGSVVDPIIQDYDTEVVVPAEPIREGYTFMGWDQDIPLTMPAIDVMLTAEWAINEYTITFESNGGSQVESITQDYNTAFTEPEQPTREGYTFEGWYRNAQLALPYTFDKMPAEDQTLYAKWSIIEYSVAYVLNEGSNSINNPSIYTVSTPTLTLFNATRTGYTFIGWFEHQTFEGDPITQINPGTTGDLTLYAKWSINQYTITFDSNGGTAVESITQDFGTEVTEPNEPKKAGYIIVGWFTNEQWTTHHIFSTMPAYSVTLYAKWIGLTMIQVGEQGTTYTIPTETDDSGTATVEGGYLISATETTYELWYEVRLWAEANGYHFENLGREGNDGTDGAAPTEDNKLRPVTTVSKRDVIVWTNALSEMTGLDPVYLTPEGVIIKDSRDSNASQVDSAIQTENNGYRLPTSYEWEMAARWRNSSGDGAISVGGRYWTPGDYASGATADYNNTSATRAVAWYSGATGGNFTRPVGQLLANHLGLYDMSGNVWELTYDWYPGYEGSYRVHRGGSGYSNASSLQVGYVGDPGFAYGGSGFRLILGQ